MERHCGSYAKGESISKIAQSYSCTPPAIHYIFKRSRQNAAKSLEQSLNGRSDSSRTIIRQSAQTPAASDPSHPTDPRREAPGSMRSTPAESSTNVGAPNALRVVLDNKAATHTPTLPDVSQPAIPQQLSQSARNTDQRSASTAELDRQLFSRAEIAIEAFRSSFDAALAKGSLVTHQRLRQAASDLMRVAARTTIALDQLNASTERSYVDKGALPLDERQGARLKPLTPQTHRCGPRRCVHGRLMMSGVERDFPDRTSSKFAIR
jgi:hypothetical protein